VDAPVNGGPRKGLEPHELVSRYYEEAKGGDMPQPLIKLFNELYEEVLHASA
jgi:hypothetical protein